MERAYKIGSVVVVGAVVLLGVSAVSLSEEKADCYLSIDLDGQYSIEGKTPLEDGYSDWEDYYHFEYDEEGRPIKVEYFKDGRLSPDRNFKVAQIIIQYTSDCGIWHFLDNYGNSVVNNRGIFSLEFKFNERGKKTEEKRYGYEGQLEKIIRYKYDENGNKIELSIYDEYENPIADNSGISIYRCKYDELGNKIEYSTYGVDGCLKEGFSGYAIMRWKYDEQGNMMEKSAYGADGKLKGDSTGCAMTRNKYDEFGNKIEESYYGVDENLWSIFIDDFPAINRWKYDENGNVIEQSFYDIYGNLMVPRMDGGISYAKACWKFDENGNELEKSYYDPDENLIVSYRYKYDKYGRMIGESIIGSDGEPSEKKYSCCGRYTGCAVTRWKYDEQGRNIETSYYGVDEQLKSCKSGYAIVRFEYDENGNKTTVFFDENEQVVKIEN